MKLLLFMTILFPFSLFSVRGRPKTPGPIFTFGQNIQPKGTFKNDCEFEYAQGDRVSVVALEERLIYGISDYLSCEIALPLFPRQKVLGESGPGIGSLKIQAEYEWYEKINHDEHFFHDATIVAAFLAPTGNTLIKTEFSSNKPMYFLGLTNSFITGLWHTYCAIGSIITQKFNDGQKIGNKIVYDFGIGMELTRIKKHYYCLILEWSGQYSRPNINPTATVPNFPQNIILLGPSLRYEHHNSAIIQIGFQYPISQPRLPEDEQISYRMGAAYSWKF